MFAKISAAWITQRACDFFLSRIDLCSKSCPKDVVDHKEFSILIIGQRGGFAAKRAHQMVGILGMLSWISSRKALETQKCAYIHILSVQMPLKLTGIGRLVPNSSQIHVFESGHWSSFRLWRRSACQSTRTTSRKVSVKQQVKFLEDFTAQAVWVGRVGEIVGLDRPNLQDASDGLSGSDSEVGEPHSAGIAFTDIRPDRIGF